MVTILFCAQPSRVWFSKLWVLIWCLFKEWLRIWVFTSLLCVNNLWQSKQLNGLSPVWQRICLVRLLLLKNGLWHKLHLNVFFFLCVCIFAFNPRFCEKDLVRREQLLGLSLLRLSTGCFIQGFCEYFLEHSEHVNCCSTSWASIWHFNTSLSDNIWVHCEHVAGFSSMSVWLHGWTGLQSTLVLFFCLFSGPVFWGLTVWVRMWFFMPLFRENNLLQMTQKKGFSPMWLRICLVRLLLTANDCPHMSHLKGFSFVCSRIWVFRLQFCVNDVLQSEQVYGFLEQDLLSNKQGYGFWSPWPLICFLKEELQANDFLYCEHEYGFYMSAHMNLHFMI